MGLFAWLKKEKLEVKEEIPVFHPEDHIDVSLSAEKFQDMKNEIVLPLLKLLLQLDDLEESVFMKNQELDIAKKKQGIPDSQVAPGAQELWEDYKQQYGKLVEPFCTSQLLKRGYAGSFGKPGEYAYLKTGCEIYFIMKSAKKAIVETHFKKGINKKHQFIFKKTDDGWKINEKKYAHGDEKSWHSYHI